MADFEARVVVLNTSRLSIKMLGLYQVKYSAILVTIRGCILGYATRKFVKLYSGL
jgi:hypothetical protein